MRMDFYREKTDQRLSFMRFYRTFVKVLTAFVDYDGQPNRRRIFSRGFLTICLVVAAVEVIILVVFFSGHA